MNSRIQSRILNLFFFLFIFLNKSISQNNSLQKVGAACPDYDLTIINYPKGNARISDFRGKALILDFWATWCIPCIQSFPKNDSLQLLFKDKIQILYVTDEDSNKVSTALDRIRAIRHITIPSVIGDKNLSKYFSHSQFPYYVWIDRDGIVKAITSDAIKGNVIDDFFSNSLRSSALTFQKQNSTKTDFNKPIFSLGLGPSKEAQDSLSYVLMTRHIFGEQTFYHITRNRISVCNLSALILFGIAFSDGNMGMIFNGRTKVISKDSTKYAQGVGWTQKQYGDWKLANDYSYELVVPIQDSLRKFEIMREDLISRFPLTADVQSEQIKCLVLSKFHKGEAFKSKGLESIVDQSPYLLKYQNVPISRLSTYLQLNYQYKKLTVVDETDYYGNIDVLIKGDINNFGELQQQLRMWDLDLKIEDRELKTIVIKDKEN